LRRRENCVRNVRNIALVLARDQDPLCPRLDGELHPLRQRRDLEQQAQDAENDGDWLADEEELDDAGE
jgi:hypothetical protein